MKVGLDAFALHPLKLGALAALDYCHQHGYAGIQFGGVRGFSRDLELSKLKEVRAYADRLGLYSHVSVQPLNAVAANKTVEEVLTDLGAQIAAAAACGWHELHGSLGAFRERYELAVPWEQQLAIATELLRRLAPVLRDHRSRVDLETHGDTTTFELVRLCETVGPDVVGICLDTANVLVFAEHPVEAAKRAAPYTHLTHTKDAIVFFYEKGLKRQGRPPGQGCIDWEAILPILARHAPDLPLSIEDHKWFFVADIFDEKWLAQQHDLSRDELAKTVKLAWETQRRIHAGDLPDPEAFEAIPYAEQMHQRLEAGRDYLNALLERLHLRG